MARVQASVGTTKAIMTRVEPSRIIARFQREILFRMAHLPIRFGPCLLGFEFVQLICLRSGKRFTRR